MKTRAFKKVLSIVCVIAMLMSICVVSFAGTASAANKDITLVVHGKESQASVAVGSAIPAPTNTNGLKFEGWYDATFTTEIKEVTDATTKAYAKFTGAAVDFENADNQIFDPKGKFAADTGINVVDQDSNKVLEVMSTGNKDIRGISLKYGNDGFKLEKGQKYIVSFYYKMMPGSRFAYDVYGSADSGINAAGDKTITFATTLAADAYEWTYMVLEFTCKDNVAFDTHKYFYLRFRVDTGTVYFDNVCISKVEDVKQTYTLINGSTGKSEQKELTPGNDVPPTYGASFQGWYDKTLTCRYDKVPFDVTTLVAKYSKMTYNFTDGVKDVYDPNNTFAANTGFKVVTEGDNKYLEADSTRGSLLNGFTPVIAKGVSDGYTLTAGQKYVLTFKYKTSSDADSHKFDIWASAKNGIGVDNNKVSVTAQQTLENSTTWAEKKFEFTVDGALDLSANKYFYFNVIANTGKIYIDDVTIEHYVAPISTDDFIMDFEPAEGQEKFQWSVADANAYTTSTGNHYVKRGDIIKEGDNSFFRLRHFLNINKNLYFTLNDGTEQFSLLNYGLYTISFKYKVEHSETPTTIGLAYVDPTTGKFKSFAELAKITASTEKLEKRDDTEWTYVTYSFGTDMFGYNECTSLALYVKNSTNVPEYDDNDVLVCTSIFFDDITVKTHAAVSEMGMFKLNALGGEVKQDSIIVPTGTKVGAIPADCTPTKHGYVFKGWKYESINEAGEAVTLSLTADTVMPYFVTEAYADWELAPGVVEFKIRTNVDSYDAQYPPIVAYPGQPIVGFPSADEVPTAAGQIFEGWYYDTGFTQKVDPEKAIDKSSTIYAKWKSEGTLITFDNYPTKYLKNGNQFDGNFATDRMFYENVDGNYMIRYNFLKGGNTSNTSSIAGIVLLANGTDYVTTTAGFDYTVTFDYKAVKVDAKCSFGALTSSGTAQWGNRMEQTGRMEFSEPTDGWKKGEFTFTAKHNTTASGVKDGVNNNRLTLGVINNCDVYIDNVVVTCEFNEMNVYGTAVIFHTNGGNELNSISGDVGTKIDFPTPVRPGYKFMGWYADKALTESLEGAVYEEETMNCYAKWMLGKYVEDMEEYPNSTKTVGVSGAYTFYNKNTAGFDPANIHGGETSLFRKGTTAGVKSFTTARESKLALTVGETYTLTMYVKPTSITDAAGTISMINMTTYTGIADPTGTEVIAKVADLKEGEWNKVSYTFTAAAEYVGISTTAGNDMYFDDITVTLKGYTGSANTGDSSVNPIVIACVTIICLGALVITGKKVFSK